MAEIRFPIQVDLPDDWVDQIIDRLRNDPDADWVDVTRCKDCKHLKRSETNSKLMMCQRRGRLLNLVGEFDFCSKAERRTDG